MKIIIHREQLTVAFKMRVLRTSAIRFAKTVIRQLKATTVRREFYATPQRADIPKNCVNLRY